jgi:hypothetical protein
MGWLFPYGASRKSLIAERTEGWERASESMVTKSVCLAHCYRGGVFSGVLWSVWERTFTKDNESVAPAQRWIQCDLLRSSPDGWGYKDMEESMHPYFYSCPLGYLKLVPMEQFGGHEQWRDGVRAYHQRQQEKRIAKRLQRAEATR